MPKIPFIVGPTAAGKTALALFLAAELEAEVISADSRQIYRYMDIVTAKPTAAELRDVRHHFVDFLDPDQAYSAGEFAAAADELIGKLTSVGKNVVVAGGSGLYVKALAEGLGADIQSSAAIRQQIRKDIEVMGLNAVHARLAQLDPQSAQRIHANDTKRIERALEINMITGEPVANLHAQQDTARSFKPVFFGLNLPREVLYDRIDQRVERMIQAGAIEETRTLLERGYSPHLVSMEGLGYREITAYLSGEVTHEEMVVKFKQKSRNYAKRQLTWFRKNREINWFDPTENTLSRIGALILEQIREVR